MEPLRTIADRFELQERVATSGFSEVHRALDLVCRRPVALKTMAAPAGQRVLREAELLIELEHDHIVRHVAHGVAADGRSYLATEWLDGVTLAERLAHGPLGAPAVRVLLECVASALLAAHARGIVHRDLKPENLLLRGGRVERVTLLDFGIARVRDGRGTPTETGTLLGTPGYMAPEQVRDSAHVDTRADMFAIGCIAYECLVGQPLFGAGDLMATLARILLDEMPPLDGHPAIPPTLARIVGALLCKDPAGRLRDAAALLAAFGDETFAPPPSATPWLTVGEQHLLSVLLVARAWPPSPGGGGARATLEVGGAGPPSAAAVRPRVADLVADYGGMLESLLDGSLIITFAGYDVATDQAAQAARCAAALRRLLPEAPMALATGGGLHVANTTGEVLDRAARLLRAAAAGELCLDDATAGLLPEGFEPPAARRMSPYVGRRRELDVLTGLWRECVDDSVARLALITGAPGIGKSRLRRELVEGLGRDAGTLLVGRGDPVQAGAPFGLLADAIRRAAGFLDGDPIVVRRAKLRARLARHLDAAGADRIVDLVGEMVGVTSREMGVVTRRDPLWLGDQMRAAWLEWMAAEAAAAPLLFVLEDLHWGDLPTVSLVEAALRELRDRPFLVVAIGRLDVHDSFPSLWRGCGMHELRLGPLSPRASRQLVEELARARLDEATVATLTGQGGGNPFFLEELVRGAAAGSDEPPATLRAMLQARLARVSPLARRVLRAGSIFGASFTAAGVAALVGEHEARPLQAALDALVADDIIRRARAGDSYVFGHALWRDAAYATLTDGDRALGHRLAGSWLELHRDDEPLRLAEHFERGGEPEQAIRHYGRAVEQSLEGDDFAATVSRVERAIVCGAAGAVRGRLRSLQAEAHAWRGEHEAAEACALEALGLLDSGADWFHAAALLADAAGKLGHGPRLVQLGETMRDAAPGDGDVEACVRMAAQLLNAGRPTLAEALFAKAEQRAAARPERDPALHGWLCHGRAVRALFVGDLGSYVELKAQAVTHFVAARDTRNETTQRVKLGYGYGEIGAYRDAEETLRAAMAIAERMGLHQVTALAQHNLGRVLACSGALDEAEAIEGEALRFFRDHGDKRLESASLMYLSMILARRGELAGAEETARQGVARAVAQSPSHAHALTNLSVTLRLLGRTDEALQASEEAVRILDKIGGMDEGESQLRLAHVEALLAAGERPAARAALALALARLRGRADRISDAASRRSFLESVEENARTLALAAIEDVT